MNIAGKHFYNTAEFSKKEILHLVELALNFKKGKSNKSLAGKTLATLFFSPSLRTRVSFTVAMQKLGGFAIDIPIREGAYQLEFEKGAVMDNEASEHIKEATAVLSRYCDAIAVRNVAHQEVSRGIHLRGVLATIPRVKDTIIKGFMKYSTIPVINMESNLYHPCQGLADMVTLVEKLALKSPARWSSCPERSRMRLLGGEGIKKKYVLTWTYHPRALPIATVNSQIMAACDLGMDIVVVHPKGWELDKEIIKPMRKRARASSGSLTFSHSMEEAFKGSNVVCAKSWGSFKLYGNWKEEKKARDKLRHWIVDKQKMKLTNNALFMHCLPVRRNVVVTDEVLDSENSIIYDQAENRLWAQMALLSTIL